MGVVYMLVYQTLFYIGSSIRTLNKRINEHNSRYKGWLNKKQSYCSSFEIIKNNNYEVITIEEVERETEEECRDREQWWIDFYGRDYLVNVVNANGFDKDYYRINHRKNHPEKNKQYRKNYYEKNREAILKQKRDYYEKNKK